MKIKTVCEITTRTFYHFLLLVSFSYSLSISDSLFPFSFFFSSMCGGCFLLFAHLDIRLHSILHVGQSCLSQHVFLGVESVSTLCVHVRSISIEILTLIFVLYFLCGIFLLTNFTVTLCTFSAAFTQSFSSSHCFYLASFLF